MFLTNVFLCKYQIQLNLKLSDKPCYQDSTLTALSNDWPYMSHYPRLWWVCLFLLYRKVNSYWNLAYNWNILTINLWWLNMKCRVLKRFSSDLDFDPSLPIFDPDLQIFNTSILTNTHDWTENVAYRALTRFSWFDLVTLFLNEISATYLCYRYVFSAYSKSYPSNAVLYLCPSGIHQSVLLVGNISE